MSRLIIDKKCAVRELGMHNPSTSQRCDRICSITDEQNRMTCNTAKISVELVVCGNLPGGTLHPEHCPYVPSCRRHIVQKMPILGEFIETEVLLIDAISAQDGEGWNVASIGDTRDRSIVTRWLMGQTEGLREIIDQIAITCFDLWNEVSK